MLWGIQQEPYAKREYEERTWRLVTDVGFLLHRQIRCFGASPDGIVGEEGLIEVKCPETSTHVEWLLDNVVPEQHIPQLTAQLAVTRYPWVDFVSFDPRLPRPYDLFVRRFEPDSGEIDKVESSAKNFLQEVSELINNLTFTHKAF